MSKGLKGGAFHHLRRHFQQHKQALTEHVGRKSQLIFVAQALGALDCLYWQALGNGEHNLAKGIRRLVVLSYRHHPIRLSMAPMSNAITPRISEAA